MFPRLALLPIGLFLVLCVAGRKYYVCHIKQACQASKPAGAAAAAMPDQRPIVFKVNSAEPVLRPSFDSLRVSVLKMVTDTSLLEIAGQYAQQEASPSGFANMGLARGEAVKKLFLSDIPAERIVVSSGSLEPSVTTSDSTTLLEAVTFREKPMAKPDAAPRVECLAGKDNSLTVYFPFGEAQREVDVKIEECLEEIVAYLKANPEKTVALTGYTDDKGTPERNLELGRQRAKHLEGILLKKGLAQNRILLSSKGENEPIASNDTEEGARLNRRTLLVVQN